MSPVCVVEVCVFALEFVQDARALGGVFPFGDQSLFEEVGQPSEAGVEAHHPECGRARGVCGAARRMKLPFLWFVECAVRV